MMVSSLLDPRLDKFIRRRSMYLMHRQPKECDLGDGASEDPRITSQVSPQGTRRYPWSKYVNRMPRGSLLSTFSSLSNLQLSLSQLYHSQLSLTIGARVRSSKMRGWAVSGRAVRG
jgi:hypothetical protein